MTSHLSSFSCRALGLAALTIALLASPTPVAAISAEEATTAKPGKFIDVSTLKPLFKKHDKVAIAGYQIAFVTRNKATANAMNLLGSGTAKASLQTFLGNVDYALMQEIVDAAYADFVAKMSEAGVQVVPRETVQAAQAYQQLETTPTSADQAYQVEFQGAHYIIVPADGLPLWFNRYDGLAGRKGSSKNLKTMAALSKELGAVVLHPSIAVDFAYLEKSGGKFSKRASVDAQNGMLVVPAASVFWASTDGFVYTKFVDGVWAGGATGKWADAKSSNNVALVKGLAGLGIDIGPVTKKKAIVLEADPVVFKAKSIELLAATSEAYKRGIQEVRK